MKIKYKKLVMCMMIIFILVLGGCGSKSKNVSDRTSETYESTEEYTTDINQDNQHPGISEESPPNTIESYCGILIDEDCSDFEDPSKHDLPCMLMYSCRDSGYGLDILQDDGSYKFIMFDETGQKLSWDYLSKTTRMYGLYVTITGKYEDGVLKVQTLKES